MRYFSAYRKVYLHCVNAISVHRKVYLHSANAISACRKVYLHNVNPLFGFKLAIFTLLDMLFHLVGMVATLCIVKK